MLGKLIASMFFSALAMGQRESSKFMVVASWQKTKRDQRKKTPTEQTEGWNLSQKINSTAGWFKKEGTNHLPVGPLGVLLVAPFMEDPGPGTRIFYPDGSWRDFDISLWWKRPDLNYTPNHVPPTKCCSLVWLSTVFYPGDYWRYVFVHLFFWKDRRSCKWTRHTLLLDVLFTLLNDRL